MWDELVLGSGGAIVLADTRRLDDSFPAIDFFEDRGLPFIVAVNEFDGASPTPRTPSARPSTSTYTPRSWRATPATAVRQDHPDPPGPPQPGARPRPRSRHVRRAADLGPGPGENVLTMTISRHLSSWNGIPAVHSFSVAFLRLRKIRPQGVNNTSRMCWLPCHLPSRCGGACPRDWTTT